MAVLSEVYLLLAECQPRPFYGKARSISLQQAMTWLHLLLGEFIKLLVVDYGQRFNEEQDELTRTVGTQTEEMEEKGTKETGMQTSGPPATVSPAAPPQIEENGTEERSPSNNKKGYIDKGSKMRPPVKTE